MNTKKNVRYFLILSTVGALFILYLAIFEPPERIEINLLEELVISILFIICCLIGISMAFNPNWLRIGAKQKILDETRKQTLRRAGHHPICERFSGHTLETNNKTYCAGCSGLAIGAAASILFMLIYILLPPNIPKNILILTVLLGMSFVIFNFSQIIYIHVNATVHLISNALLIIGSFLVVTSLFLLTGKIIFGILGLLISILWLDTRIILSKWNHQKLCFNCIKKCEGI